LLLFRGVILDAASLDLLPYSKALISSTTTTPLEVLATLAHLDDLDPRWRLLTTTMVMEMAKGWASPSLREVCLRCTHPVLLAAVTGIMRPAG
jgi:hypothetical protein